MHKRFWQKIEAGETNLTVRTLVRLGIALGVDPVELLKEPTRRGPEPPATSGAG